ncbi:MAG: tryptophan synthase subunit alpha [Bacteroidetes bacterium]|nr:tryptophan synthase subunit alpha [Bacteroidota bacterium]
MENRITNLFQNKKKGILSIYFTAGYPGLNDTITTIKALEDAGVDMVEIGIPFSDPIADGPVIQHSSEVALKNGMNLKLLFEQLIHIRNTVKIPLLLMGYLNPVLQFGVKKFCKQCSIVGIDGIIIPDLPLTDYLQEYKDVFEAFNLSNIFLITPQTSKDRINLIDKNTNGFIYMVAMDSTTGRTSGINAKQVAYFDKIKKMKLRNPTVTGFGIYNNTTFKKALRYANGAIIGSAFIKAINNSGNLENDIIKFVKAINLN